MTTTIKNIKGMVDLLPEKTALWQTVERTLQDVLDSFGYREIRLPVAESTHLFKRSIGEVTDIVEKEMYTFDDRNGDSMTLRPEGTAGCVRACLQHALLDNSQQQRLWYQGPMFRYERPQKGRQRQFHQLGVEVFNIEGAEMDAELILLSATFWERLGISDYVCLELNSIGTLADRKAYRQALLDYLTPLRDQLDTDSQKRLSTNPLRILDSKDEQTQSLLTNAPVLRDYLSETSKAHFRFLRQLLDKAQIPYTVNDRLVRGLDYYSDTVFEWVTEHLGAQGTVCGGGRYDALVEQLGGKPCPAIGFALGLERLTLLLESLNDNVRDSAPDVYFVIACESQDAPDAYAIAQDLRRAMPELRMITHCGGGSFKSQMKKADKSGAKYALILGSNELQSQTVAIKSLREKSDQQLIPLSSLSDSLGQLV